MRLSPIKYNGYEIFVNRDHAPTNRAGGIYDVKIKKGDVVVHSEYDEFSDKEHVVEEAKKLIDSMTDDLSTNRREIIFKQVKKIIMQLKGDRRLSNEEINDFAFYVTDNLLKYGKWSIKFSKIHRSHPVWLDGDTVKFNFSQTYAKQHGY